MKMKECLAHTPLPEADQMETKGERVEKWLMRAGAMVLLAVWGLLGFGVWITYCEDFLFPRLYANPVNYIGTAYVLIPLVLAAVVLFCYWKRAPVPEARKKRRWIARIVFGTALLVALQPLGLASLILMPPVYSETDDPEHYLTLGTYAQMYGNDIHKLFPANIPGCAVAQESKGDPADQFPDTTQYYYYYQEVIDPSFQIYAEWILPEGELAAELGRIQNNYPEGPAQQAQWGDWTCLSFTDDTLDFAQAKELIYYYYLIFAYNEQTGAVRYIASYSMDCGREEDPYFLLLQWQ